MIILHIIYDIIEWFLLYWFIFTPPKRTSDNRIYLGICREREQQVRTVNNSENTAPLSDALQNSTGKQQVEASSTNGKDMFYKATIQIHEMMSAFPCFFESLLTFCFISLYIHNEIMCEAILCTVCSWFCS